MNEVHLTRFSTSLGVMTLASTPKGVVTCTLPGQDGAQVRRWLVRQLPGVPVVEGIGRNGPAVAALKAYLAGKRADLDLPLDLRGTVFQKKVWRALCKVPFGGTVTYGQLAAKVGHGGAARACGSANGANPVPLFVPCHRVIASDGSLGGFGGGLPLKRKLLALEQAGCALPR